ncbi:SURF1 family protein [Phyllobacterium sp. SB3]|uniref:SURF1 family protein n=1 Tax=Phyllobacterium sp. SB3 TaxID=3156073 RepID=UPI0032AF9256
MTAARTARRHAASGDRAGRASNTPIKLILIGILILFCIAILVSLGVWQLERRVWKLGLINQVEQRVNAPATQAPGPDLWARINAKDFAYLHVTTSGRFLEKPATLVQAVTNRGSGFWVLSPFQSSDGFSLLINRGFVPTEKAGEDWRPDRESTTTVSGLLRVTEPDGGFLRSNEPATGRWYSRDVAAIAAKLNIDRPAPYFIDADANQDRNQLPIGGLTVVAFANNHLVYALTWFGMALMLGVASIIIGRSEWQTRHSSKTQIGMEL